MSGEPSQHEVDHGELDEGLGRLEAALVVLGEPAGAAEPREGALDNPAARLHREAALALLAPDDLDPDASFGSPR